MAVTTKPLIQPNAQNQYEVTTEDLPLSCPMPQMYLWNSHPRVYLPIEELGHRGRGQSLSRSTYYLPELCRQ